MIAYSGKIDQKIFQKSKKNRRWHHREKWFTDSWSATPRAPRNMH